MTTADFAWAYQETSAASSIGNHTLADALANVAAYLFDPADTSSIELVYANQSHPVWPYVKWWFEPVALDSEQANLWRQAHGNRGEDEDDEPWSGQDEFVAKLNQWLADAAAGDSDAFWRLAYHLQGEPATGKGPYRNDDDLLDFPGVAALGANHVDVLIQAAIRFLTAGHDHANEWLGTDRYDRRGWAGYLALALLERQGRLSDLPDHAWASWVGALIWFHAVPVNAGDRDLKIRLLSRAAQHAAGQLAYATAKYLRGELTHGHLASEVDLIDPAWHDMLLDTWADLLVEIAEAITSTEDGAVAGEEPVGETAGSTPLDTTKNGPSAGPATLVLSSDESRGHALYRWEAMLGALLRASDTRGVEVAQGALDIHASGERHRHVAIRAARALLCADAAAHLFEIIAMAERDPALGREIALACATRYDDGSILNNLDEDQLASMYRWISMLFRPEDDMHREGAHFVSPDEQARDWRDRILSRLGERGTERAVLALAKLREEYPHRLILTSNLLRARTNMFAIAWSPPSPDELAALFQDGRRRLVRSERELADLLVEVLQAIETDLPAHGELLWDRLPKRVLPEGSQLDEGWLPKPEAALSAYIAHELANRLERRGLAVNREVLVRPTNAYGSGDRTDIQVEATMRDDIVEGPTPDRFTVVIEIKGPWNKGLATDQREQLAKRYLPEAHTALGIYVVGWFPLDLWSDPDDYRREVAKKVAKDELAAELEAQANGINAELDVRTIPFLLTIPRPHHLAHNAGK